MTSTMLERDPKRDLLQVFLAVALGLALLATFLLLAGFRVTQAMNALWQGSFGSWYVFTSAKLVHSSTLIVLWLAFTFVCMAGAFYV
jgi:ABC-type uncharacterized transport system permease subunit